MAIYHVHHGFVSRSTGRSPVQSAAYICGEKLYEERREKFADFSKKAGEVAVTNTLFPENSKYRDIGVWNAIENFEDRYAEEHFKTEETRENYKSSAQTASTIIVALPNELSVETNKELLEEFINTRFTSRGLITTYAIHQKEGNLHAHLITTRRAIDENGEFQKRKDREICTKSAIMENRKLWADLANKFLEREGFSERINEKSFADLGIDLEATKHRGWYADTIGTDSRIAQENLEIFKENEKKILANPSIILDYLNEKKAVFTQKDILRELNKRVFDETKIEGIFEKILDSAKYVGENTKGEFVYTGEKYQKLESDVLNQFEKIANQDAKTQCSGEVIERVLNKYDYLNEEQRNAVKTLTSDRNLSILIGKAGAGKTTTMKAVAEIYKDGGARVIGMSLSAVASENLGREANIESGTIASWMHQRRLFEEAREKFLSFNEILAEGMLKQLDWYAQLKNFEKTDLKSSDVIIVDEAGMVGTHDWHDILEFAGKTGAKIIAIGDDNQIKPISSGDCFRAVLSNLNDVGHLDEIRRQNADWQKEASVEFSKLNTAKALSIYEHHGKIHEMTDVKQIAEKFLGIEKIGSAAVLCTTKKECAEINSEIRNLKKANGELGENLFNIGEKSFAKNDQIIFTQNNKSFAVKNGETAVIEKFENGILTVKSGEAGEIEKQIDMKSYDKIDHAYAITITKSQGKTYDNTIVVANPIMDAKNTYVAMTRHRENVDLYYRNSDFKDVKSLMSGLSKYNQKDLVQDYSSGGNRYRERVQEYTELSLERISVLKDINKGEATWEDYSKINERRTELGKEIAQDYSNHKLYLEQQGLTLEKLEIQCKLKERPLSNFEIEAKNRVEKYVQVSKNAHDLLNSIKQETQNITQHEKYAEYCEIRSERNKLAREIIADSKAHREFINEASKDSFVSKETMEKQLDYTEKTQREFLEKIDGMAKEINKNEFYCSAEMLIEYSRKELGMDLYQMNSEAHKAEVGYGFQINHSMIEDYINHFKLDVKFNPEIAEHASMLADKHQTDSKEPISAEIANNCIKQALCYEVLKESNKDLKTPYTTEQLQGKASELSKHIKEENISVLNDKNLMQEALFKIDGNSQEAQNVDLKQMYVDRELEKQLQTELSRSVDIGLER